jgi:hypothetical protein
MVSDIFSNSGIRSNLPGQQNHQHQYDSNNNKGIIFDEDFEQMIMKRTDQIFLAMPAKTPVHH